MFSYESQLMKKRQTSYSQQTKALLDSAAARLVKMSTSSHMLFLFFYSESGQVYAWGDNDHGQQGNSTTTVNRKPAMVSGLEGYHISRVACGSSHSVCWTTNETPMNRY